MAGTPENRLWQLEGGGGRGSWKVSVTAPTQTTKRRL